jgi:hypothetical protein
MRSLGQQRLGRDTLAMASSVVILTFAGFAFWVVAGHRLSPSQLAETNAVVSVGMFLAGVAQLNFVTSLPAVLPRAGAHALRLLLRSYAIAAAFAGILAAGLQVVAARYPSIPHVHGRAGVLFVVGVALWTVFSIQDSALAASGLAPVVPIENSLYSASRIVALVLLLTALAPDVAAVASWFLPTILFIVPVNALLARRSNSRVSQSAHRAASQSDDTPRPPDRLMLSDACASIFTQAQARLVPFVAVIMIPGPKAAQLVVAWLFWVTTDVLLVNVTVPLTVVVASTTNAADRNAAVRKVFRLGLSLTIGLAVAGGTVADRLLHLILPTAPPSGALVIRLVLIALVPRTVYHVTLAVARGQHQSRTVLIMPVLATVVLFISLAPGFIRSSPAMAAFGLLASQLILAAVALKVRTHQKASGPKFRLSLLRDAR